ncbi:DUF6541 family protein [Pseudarthrobacter sp. H2]|uniref:DUF6541 family protein n=1 Tax=Pseudarthrobacter sp. H2 TaxID=3418415 RepID=UPI003CF15D4F
MAIGLFFIPGAIVAWTSRVRGMALFAMAPAITVSIVAVSALLAPVANVRWSLLPVAVVTILVAAVAFAAGTWLLKKDAGREPRPVNWWAGAGHAAAVIAAAVLISRRLIGAFGRPEAFSQTFDNVFHLNAVRYIQDTGSGSSFTVSSMTGGGFYPSAWHDVVALLAGLTGASIPVAVNVTNLVVGSLAWPLGCMFLAHKLLGNRVVVSVAAGILAAGFGAFPILLLDFGVLYPNFLGNALLPTALGLGIQALGLAHQESRSRWIDCLLLFAVLPGITLAHPSSTMALLALMVPPLVLVWARATAKIVRGTRRRWARLGGMVALLALGVAGLAVAWKTIRPPEVAAFWPPVETTGQAIGEVLTASGIGRPVAWAIMALSIAGLVSLLVRRTQLWAVGMYLVMAGLFVAVTSFPFGPVRTFFTGVWYNDPPRLASLLPVVILPLAAVGAVRCWDTWILPLAAKYPLGKNVVPARWPVGPAALTVGVVGLLLAGLLVGGTQQANVREAAISASAGYRMTNDSPLISSDEMALISRLPQEVPEGATMAGNPWNGSALAYAFTGRKLLQFHLLSALPDGAEQVFTHLNAANSDPSVCPAVRRLNVDYVLDFGHREVHGGDNGFKGLDNLEASGVATLVDSQGQAKLYKLTACGQ